ncbi:NAD(P)/FAD-dependent oxidoreductase [Allobranchiibius sp. GilTou73]|uniref:NAD(P)/FAD-dependent oxidoreductase n=1 Tax=Allobranchiibius sp. GilTou73 TaxID=2904523 RepID=UPI001F1B6008|nr:FAD-dependent oxidoreductase [Allobranchiibius sp. GilTou73]UIJ33453.1 FAD-dependent oxidoreductase [Allobranchiibius sp. GilTou73]
MSPRRYAVIGSGVAGLTAAHVLSKSGDVSLYEADERPGGHAHTHDVPLPDGSTIAVDSGFIVHNDRTYPTLQRLFRELDVPTQPTDMSMSVYVPQTGFQYAGGKGLSGILADAHTTTRPGFCRMLIDVKRFHRRARALLDGPEQDDVTMQDWLGETTYGRDFTENFIRPVIAAVWSCPPDMALHYPARSLLQFLDHHGMLTVSGSPTWRTVTGGSRVYVERVVAGLHRTLLNTPVASVRKLADGVEVGDFAGSREVYDGVVIATHPHQALAMLAQPTAAEERVFSAMPYSVNTAQLHTDSSVLPSNPRAWGSWNYLSPEDEDGVVVTYDLTRLMRLPSPDGTRMLVTLGGEHRVDKRTVIAQMTYEHPLYTLGSLRAQRELPSLSDDRVAFAGAYHGSGFHEDGALSGLQAATRLGGTWE